MIDNTNVETKNKKIDTFQSMLDAAGFVPVYGEPADAANAIISLLRGNPKEAAWNALSMLPFLGGAASIKKLELGKKGEILKNKKNEEIRQGWFEESMDTAMEENPDLTIGDMDTIATLMSRLGATESLEKLITMLRRYD
tara:strand:- start:441 stop:860 length:420 start_codon:yes stop_codon:yes gene_type:complete